MAHLQYMPGDPRLVDQLVYELKSKGIFDQFRKDCISDVDTKPAYQNLRQRVESSVAVFLSRQAWHSDLNKNQLREKLRKHILDGNYLEQGVERIVDQVVNPKVASVFIPQVEDLVYNYLGITRKKAAPEANEKGSTSTDLLPTDLEAVSPGSVKSHDDDKEDRMEIDVDEKSKDLDISMPSEPEQEKDDTRISGVSDLTSHDSDSLGKLSIPMPSEEINLENIPSPENSPPKIDLDSIEMPKEEQIELKDIPLPDESPKDDKEQFFKPVASEDDSSSDSSIIRNMSPLTPIRNFNNENSCDAQQAFENDTETKSDDKKEPSSFRFTIEAKSSENSSDDVKDKDLKPEKEEQQELSYQFNEQVNINSFNTPQYDDSSNSHNLQIDYESDVNSKTNLDKIPFPDDPNSEESKKESEEKKVHKSSHRSRDSHRHSSSKDRKTDSKSSSSKDRRDSKNEKKSSKDDPSKSKSSSDKSKDRGDKKDSKDSKHKSSQSSHSSHKSSSTKDSKHRSSSSSQRHSSKHDDRKSSSSSKDKERTSDKSSKEQRSSKDSKSRSDKDKKSKRDEKDKDKKDKKDSDDHYSASGRGNQSRRSTDRDSNDGSSSSKGSHNPSSKSSQTKTKGNSSKSDNTSPSSESTSPSDKEKNNKASLTQSKPIVRVDTHLERPIGTPPRLPFVPDVTLKKPKFAANLAEAKRLMKMRKFLDEEQKRMNQEAALLLEFQANVRPSLSQVYSSISGPELEFACVSNVVEPASPMIETNYAEVQPMEQITDVPDAIEMELTEMNRETKKEIAPTEVEPEYYQPIKYKADFEDTEKILNEISKKVYGLVNEEHESSEVEYKPKEEIIEVNKKEDTEFEIRVVTEEINETDALKEVESLKNDPCSEELVLEPVRYDERPLEYFAEHEKFDAELERAKFEKFLKEYIATTVTKKLYLINCDAYEESVVKEVAETFGQYEIVNYHKNGHKKKNIVKDVNVSNEIVLPLDRNKPVDFMKSPVLQVFSPAKSECSFELSSDYDAKLEEMVNKTSRQEIMEIILGGGAPLESPCKMPQIDYCMDDNIESNNELKRCMDDNIESNNELKRCMDDNIESNNELKRKLSMDSTDNNNHQVLIPTKIRKLSESDQISSTTEEAVDDSSVKTVVRSKYLGKARRVGLPRPKRTAQPNSPSSDKSVENYDTNTPPNGKLTQRKVQRYDTSDLYKPKLHYLSRRNNIS